MFKSQLNRIANIVVTHYWFQLLFALDCNTSISRLKHVIRPRNMISDTTSSSGKPALIVEDNADCAELLKLILEDENWRVECVESGSEALRVLTDGLTGEVRNFDPDVMILDLRLPDMAGLEVIEQLQNRRVRVPPTVIITAGPPFALKEAMGRVGTIGLRKPFDFEELFSAIAAALSWMRTSSIQNQELEIR